MQKPALSYEVYKLTAQPAGQWLKGGWQEPNISNTQLHSGFNRAHLFQLISTFASYLKKSPLSPFWATKTTTTNNRKCYFLQLLLYSNIFMLPDTWILADSPLDDEAFQVLSVNDQQFLIT